jgi:MFS superfamily sulfate permease-like transporter
MRGQHYVRRHWQAASSAARSALPKRENLKADVLAGLPGAISSVPDGMAASVLAGVSPVHGLYASIGGRIGGGASQSTVVRSSPRTQDIQSTSPSGPRQPGWTATP